MIIKDMWDHWHILGIFLFAEGEFFIQFPEPIYAYLSEILKKLILYGEKMFPEMIWHLLLDLSYWLIPLNRITVRWIKKKEEPLKNG